MAGAGFLTLGGESEAEHRVQGSRFLALALRAADETAVRERLQERARLHFAATHHCAAWRFRDGTWRALDAGEPSGSAGAPILAAIDACVLDDVAVLVTRYFGGTKLGIGGLARAYGRAAGLALAEAPRSEGVPAVPVEVLYSFESTAGVMRAVSRFAPHEMAHGYSADVGKAKLAFLLPAHQLGELVDALGEQSAGSAQITTFESTVLYRPA